MVLADWWGRVTGNTGKREVFPSRFGEATVYAMPAEDGSLVRMLNVGGVLQSATYLDERWATCPSPICAHSTTSSRRRFPRRRIRWL